MAQNTYDMAGVLTLSEATPVIHALFDSMGLDMTYPGHGKAYIANMDSETDMLWDSVAENLAEVAASLEIPVLEEADLEDLLWALAGKFGCAENEDFANFMDQLQPDDNASLDARFFLAKCFNDGHGLVSFEVQGAWSCSKPRLFEFGGHGSFQGRHFSFYADSMEACDFASKLEGALADGQMDVAADVIEKNVNQLLNGIADGDMRDRLRQKLAQTLQEAPRGNSTGEEQTHE